MKMQQFIVVAYDELVLLPLLMQVYKLPLPFVEEPQTYKSLSSGNLVKLFHTINTIANAWT
jgi:hypothetical protein